MASFLDQLGSGLGTLVGGAGNAGAASSNAWNYGQYSPFTANNPMGTTSFNGTTATGTLSPLQQQLQGAYGGAVTGGLNSAGGLGQQYNNIFGNFQGNVNSQFNSLQAAQAPWIAQNNASNLDNEFSKGTLASTAGGYQTAGQDMANNSQMNSNMASAQNYALGLANSQMSGANSVANTGLNQANIGVNGLNTQNTGFLQQMQAAGNLGAQRSGANVAAATPGIGTGEMQDQATSGLLSGLLFGGGSQGGLLNSLLGGAGSTGGGLAGGLGALGSGIGSLFGGSSSSPNYSSNGNLSNLANQGYGGYSPPGMSNIGIDPVGETDEGSGNWWD